jgi:hypothetical protein
MNVLLVLGTFFMLLPLLVVWFGNHEKISTIFFSFLTVGCWVIGGPLAYIGLNI